MNTTRLREPAHRGLESNCSPGFAEAFRFWLKFGFISFSGATGQIAITETELADESATTGYQVDPVIGWLDDRSQRVWGRPVDVKPAADGKSLFISDDQGHNFFTNPRPIVYQSELQAGCVFNRASSADLTMGGYAQHIIASRTSAVIHVRIRCRSLPGPGTWTIPCI